SLGVQRCWKGRLIDEMFPVQGANLIDVACGTGDIGYRFIRAGGRHVHLCDSNKKMLEVGKSKLFDKSAKLFQQMSWNICNAENLPFEDEAFNYYSIAFGLRNVTDIDATLREAYRVLVNGGKFLCLELSPLDSVGLFSQIYDFYSFQVVPKIGRYVTKNESAYLYLVESIRQFLKPECLQKRIEVAGFQNVRYFRLTFGIATIHVGYKRS
ncbi:ubiquinone/menaquinone biosynthesis methyltransferase, partial [Rickettsiales endosymbiont of Peranema trichophorum]|uniref:ubiquinone/menaquinone biosynthesis methyltransferase n=1 Tax=Rickettsiales endosymbiont of Peranema trichophorum TaxID=2486577 RepID=UPI001023A5BE